MELVQIRLIVDDFGACFRFYRDVLGLKPQVDDESGPYGKLTLPGGAAAVALHTRADVERELPWLGGRAEGDAALVVLKVADLESVAADLASRGARWVAGPQPRWGMRVAYLRDPEGNLIEFQQWPAPSEG